MKPQPASRRLSWLRAGGRVTAPSDSHFVEELLACLHLVASCSSCLPVQGLQTPTVAHVDIFPALPNTVIATVNGVSVFNGGFGSALDKSPFRNDEYYLLADRGPNFDGAGSRSTV